MDTGKICAKGGSTKFVRRARVIAGDSADLGNVRQRVARKPSALVFKDEEKADLHARVCGDCGYTELFVDDAESIYRAYEDARRNLK